MEEFVTQFATFTNGYFEGFDFSNVIVIGGSVIGSLLPVPSRSDIRSFRDSDSESDDIDESTGILSSYSLFLTFIQDQFR